MESERANAFGDSKNEHQGLANFGLLVDLRRLPQLMYNKHTNFQTALETERKTNGNDL